MAGTKGSDPGELLAKALDLAVGSVGLARYAANQTGDRRLRRTFQHLAHTGEQQARALRRELAGYAVPQEEREPWGGALVPLATGTAAGLAAIALAGLIARVVVAPPDDPLRRRVVRALGPLAGLVGLEASPPPGQ